MFECMMMINVFNIQSIPMRAGDAKLNIMPIVFELSRWYKEFDSYWYMLILISVTCNRCV